MPLALQHLLTNDALRQSLTSEHLPAFLAKQRWYTSKGKAIDTIELEALPSWSREEGLWLAHITFVDSSTETRVLALAEVDRSFALQDARVVCHTDGGVLVDAVEEEGFRESLYNIIAGGRELEGKAGTLRGIAGNTVRAQPTYSGSKVPPQNSSNTVITFAAEGFFKLFRRVEPGRHPDAELIAYLSAERGFGSVPEFGGALEFAPADGSEPISLGLMLGRVAHQGEAWETMLHDVAAYAKRYQADPELANLTLSGNLAEPLHAAELQKGLAAAMGAQTIKRIALLGTRTAEMHLHFAAGAAEGVSVSALDDAYWASAKTQLVDRLAAELAYAGAEVTAPLHTINEWLKGSQLPRLIRGCTRVHGDYHLGQVLSTADDVVIIDFEGEPLHSLEYRRRRHPPFKDVAGMVRSLHYAPYAQALQELDGAEWAMNAAKLWYHAAARIFLTAYFDAAGAADFVPQDAAQREQLLAFFLADKALYELAYERASRPGWLPIPRAGIVQVGEMLVPKG